MSHQARACNAFIREIYVECCPGAPAPQMHQWYIVSMYSKLFQISRYLELFNTHYTWWCSSWTSWTSTYWTFVDVDIDQYRLELGIAKWCTLSLFLVWTTSTLTIVSTLNIPSVQKIYQGMAQAKHEYEQATIFILPLLSL